MCSTWLSTVRSDNTRTCAICLFAVPFATDSRHLGLVHAQTCASAVRRGHRPVVPAQNHFHRLADGGVEVLIPAALVQQHVKLLLWTQRCPQLGRYLIAPTGCSSPGQVADRLPGAGPRREGELVVTPLVWPPPMRSVQLPRRCRLNRGTTHFPPTPLALALRGVPTPRIHLANPRKVRIHDRSQRSSRSSHLHQISAENVHCLLWLMPPTVQPSDLLLCQHVVQARPAGLFQHRPFLNKLGTERRRCQDCARPRPESGLRARLTVSFRDSASD